MARISAATSHEAETVAPGPVLDTLPAGVLIINLAGLVIDANERACDVLGQPRGTLVGADVAEVLVSVDRIEALALGGGPWIECEAVRPDGTSVPIGLSAAVIGRSTVEAMHYSVVLHEAHEWEQLRNERDRLLQLAVVSEIFPAMLHELKNPLAAIAAAVEVLLEDIEPGETQDTLHAVLSEIRRLKLGFEGIGAVGRSLSCAEHHAVDHALRETMRVLRRRAESRGVDFVCNVVDMPLLPFDPGVIRALGFNLLTNALHACSAGDTVTLDASLVHDGATLEIGISDTGKGMPPDVLARCRELFFTTRRRGSGIGLALCARAVESVGGSLEISSKLDEGTRVLIRIPTKPAHQPSGVRQKAP